MAKRSDGRTVTERSGTYAKKAMGSRKATGDPRFGERLRASRERAGIEAADLATTLGVNQDTVYQWELGKHFPSPENLRKISKLLSVSIDFLFEGENLDEGLPALRPALRALLRALKPEELELLSQLPRETWDAIFRTFAVGPPKESRQSTDSP